MPGRIGVEYRFVRTARHPLPSTVAKLVSAKSKPSLAQREKMLSFSNHQHAGRFHTIANDAALILFTGCQQAIMQIRKIAHLRNWRQVIPPEVTTFSFHTSFFMSLTGCAETGFEAPMRTKCDEPHRLFALAAAQNPLHG